VLERWVEHRDAPASLLTIRTDPSGADPD